MAAKLLTLGQNRILSLLKTFILGVRCAKSDQNETTRSWDITDFTLFSTQLKKANFQKWPPNG